MGNSIDNLHCPTFYTSANLLITSTPLSKLSTRNIWRNGAVPLTIITRLLLLMIVRNKLFISELCFRLRKPNIFQQTRLNEIGLVVFAEVSVGVEQETCRLICGSKPKVPPPSSLDQSKLITQPDIIRPRNVERTNKSTIIEVTDKQEREIQIWFKYTFSTAPICSLGGRATP